MPDTGGIWIKALHNCVALIGVFLDATGDFSIFLFDFDFIAVSPGSPSNECQCVESKATPQARLFPSIAKLDQLANPLLKT